MSDVERPVLTVRGVTKVFGEGASRVEALRGVDLDVDPGEVVLIMGPSGSGKTTLLSIIGALLKPTAGTVRIGEDEVTVMSEHRLPAVRIRQVGFVFQDFNLLSALTARENVQVVLDFAGVSGSKARQRATELLEGMELGQRLDFLPEKLSGGEKQRVAIARAMANDPALLLCDEPTANLDSRIGHDVVVRLREIADQRGKSVVIVSHDERIKPHADRVLWLDDGVFREMATMAVDPVCGMAIERETAPAHLEVDGETYYFCSRGCMREFQEEHVQKAQRS
ncbi:MAG: ATP-binding cassette domain-containing protein [Coriobacteriales bacterium]|nr:ATP-binding cassette domain-containing protein [Coriobacteriales bacterium]